MVKNKKKAKTKKEKIKEIFTISKKGKEKIIEKKGVEEIPVSKKGQIEHQNKILRNFLIGIGIFIIILVVFVLSIKSLSNFEYENLEFEMVNEYNILFYKTTLSFFLPETNQNVKHSFFLRKDPRKLEEIPFNGEFVLLNNVVLNSTDDFICDGDGTISIGNLLNLQVSGMKIFKDPNLSCNDQGLYTFLNILSGNETKIEQFGYSCYNLYVNNCEILDVTERLMVETLIELQKIIDED